MKKVVIYIFCLICCLSCVEKDPVIPIDADGRYISLTLVAPDLVATTKATADSDPLHENVVRTLNYYFFQKSSLSMTEPADNQKAVFLGKETLTENNQVFTSAPGYYELNIKVNDSDVNNLIFKRPNTQCFIYVVANAPTDLKTSGVVTYSEIKNYGLTNVFTDDVQPQFVMEGLSTLELADGGRLNNQVIKTEDGKNIVYLDRVASKLSISVKFADSFEGDADDSDDEEVAEKDKLGENVEWEPILSTMKVEFKNWASKAVIGGDFIDDYGRIAKTGPRDFVDSELENYKTTLRPFYTYPFKWTSGSDVEPYLLISVKLDIKNPVTEAQIAYKNGTSKKTCYYKVVFPWTEFSQNTWHKIKLEIKALGTWSEDAKPIKLENQIFSIADWKTATESSQESGSGGEEFDPSVNAIIKDATYLVVPQNEYVIKNLNDLSFVCTSSHSIEIANLKIYRVNSSTGAKEDITNTISAQDRAKIVYNTEFTVTVSKTLQKLSTSKTDYDVTPYMYEFDVRHVPEEGKPEIKEHIKVTQYPAIYIDPDMNSDSANNKKGYVYVNNGQSTTNNWQFTNGKLDLNATDNNNNPYMYRIVITAIDGDTKCADEGHYIIADPRGAGVKMSTLGVNTTAPGYNANKLYYPTGDTDGTNNTNDYSHVIAPSLRIASSYGKCYPLSKADAVKRCSAYQEDGYPAGRWRVPTYAEINFMIKLSGDGKIPRLFSENSYYWSSTTAIKVNNGVISTAANPGNVYVRCVYDDWYWHSDDPDKPETVNKTTFTWGNE